MTRLKSEINSMKIQLFLQQKLPFARGLNADNLYCQNISTNYVTI